MSNSQHWYDRAGNLVDPWTPGAYPSVSTILDCIKSDEYDAMVRRMGQEAADELMAEKAARGTRVHKACELVAKDHKNPAGILKYEEIVADTLEDGEEPCLLGFIAWANENVKQFIELELFVLSDKYGYGGRLDIIAELNNGQRWLIDIKTGMDSVRHGLQLKLYQQAYYEMTGIRCRMGVLALDPKRKCGYRHSRQPFGLKEYKEPWTAAEPHIKVFKWWHKKNPPKRPVDSSLIWKEKIA